MTGVTSIRSAVVGLGSSCYASSRRVGLLALAVVALLLTGCAGQSVNNNVASSSEGLAAYYGKQYNGRRTASGERFNAGAMTAAHRTLAFGTRVRVTNRDNGRQVVVRINDRGPFTKGRIIDLSPAAARQLDMIKRGVVPVRLDVLE
ncbi:septal ring lytic transglycosylase RlpA family protein [Phytohalomonas tamaricis]|uniref:septal ring lytic transglycosylase RlpA family protein n=1 Tax=Phytohalomonas tamaricis TaxID=2081032 RepID=UPI000D0B9403|nr:septal ring lytic transglycosylase RlpA family protein [Phytohalomonas tamaricis]